jgi:hypothetical protein
MNNSLTFLISGRIVATDHWKEHPLMSFVHSPERVLANWGMGWDGMGWDGRGGEAQLMGKEGAFS